MLKFKNPMQTSCNGYLPPLWVPFVRRVLFLAIRQGHGSDGAGLPSGSTVSTPCQCHRQGRYKIAHLVTLRVPADSGPMTQSVIGHKVGDDAIAVGIDAVNQGNWSLSIQ